MQNKPKKPGRWRRRTIWTLGILIILGFVARATVPLALPVVLRKIAGNFGMTCVYDRLELNLFSGDAGIWGLEFKPKEGGEAILSADYCHGNISVLNLCRGKLNVWRIEADGVDVSIDRNADGHIPLLDRFIASTSAKSGAPSTPTAANNNPKSMDLSSPLRVDALRLDHIRVHIHDRGVSPEVDTELAMDLRLSDLGSAAHPAKFEMNLSADPLLDTLRVTGEGHSAGKTLDAKLNVLVRGIRLKPAAAYLAPLGFRPVSDSITLTATGQVHTAPAPNNAEGFTASVAFDHLSALADRQESLALDHLNIDTGVIDTKSIRINRFILYGARAAAGRASDGNLQIAGIEYDPSIIAGKPTTPASPSTTPPLLLALMAERWSIGELALKNGRLDFHDQGIAPTVDLSLVADELSATSIDHDPANLNSSVTLTGRLHAPGMIRDITIDGTATPFADDKKFAVILNATGIKPDAIKPYLDPIGIESTLKDGQFTAAANASLKIGDTLSANASVRFDFRDYVPLLSSTIAAVSGATLDPRTGKIVIADIELSGPGVSVLRDRSGELAAFGFRTKPAVASVASATPSPKATVKPPASQPFAMASLPRITLAKFGWNGLRVDLEDQTTTPPTRVSIPDIAITASDLSTDAELKTPGHFKLWLASPQVARQLQAVGSVSALPNGVKVFAKLEGLGLNTTPFSPYLKPMGIEPVLKDGALTGMGTATVQLDSTGPSASVSLQEMKYTDGTNTLASVDQVLIEGASLKNDGVSVNRILIADPHATARRDADGSFEAAGLRILPPAKTDDTSVAPTVATVSTATKPAAPSASPLLIFLPNVRIENGSIDWTDLAVQPSVQTSASASVQIQNLTLGKDAPPANFGISAKVDGAVDQFEINGLATIGPSRKLGHLEIKAAGLRAGAFAAYLPPGVGCSLKDGKFAASVDVKVLPNPAGGIAAELAVGPLQFEDDATLFHLDSVHVKAPRIDLPDTAMAINEILVTGVQTHAEKLPNGDLACMGLLIQHEAPSPKPVSELPRRSGSVGATIVAKTPTTGPSVADLVAASHRVLPSVTLEKLDLNVANLTLKDGSRPTSAPLIISDLNLHNVNRIDLLGKDAEGKPPTKLELACKVSPLVDRVRVDVAVSPFARQPHLKVDFSATGVHGDGLTQLVPELKDQVDGTAMDSGALTAHFEADAKLDRRTPVDFDVSHGFDLSFVLDKVAYRSKPDGPVLAGVDEVRSEGIRIVPDESIVHVKTLEITEPIGLITQDKAGIHALGWTYKLPTATPATQPVVATKSDAGSEGLRRAGSGAPETLERPKGEIRIDKLLISGLDFYVEDTAVTPPLVIPLNGLDVEVRNLSSLAPYEDSPIRFSAIVNAGKVNLPKHGSNPPVMEQRDLFSQITANGEVSLYPKLHGWAKTSVSSLDLAALQGAAAQFNETLTAGLYDSTVDLRFDPTGAVVVNSRFTLTDLSLSEPPGGLIYRTLHLPAPLDACIGAVQGADGSIALPVNLSVDPKDVSYVSVGTAAAGAVVNVITTAVLAAPQKTLNDFGGIIGLGGKNAPQDLTTTIPFAPGSAAFGPEQSAAIARLLQELHDDSSLTVTLKQQLGGGDVDLSRVRANPTSEQSASLESQLRSRKAQLLQLRADAAGRARADLVSLGESAAADSLDHLRAIDREIAATDESLDEMGELLKPGADRLANRRTKAAALQIANDRLSAVRAALLAAGVDHDRVKMLSAQFNPSDDKQGGKLVILVVKTK
jgi:hypothetical protein